ncbi:MAG: NAD(P)-dependent glycerol-3-phosphate dehydrogenase [Gammaproteobacteria bacterium]|nr:NAD(P)-dependent glycerol-3-phosphate dehydrogenase [Gammaproteobacteria bacterium]MCP5199308.1 NAD(P)-dependent glycerol-3-phosphate dehydrogenase [Gammaproteobacteria bacterium]
MAPPRVLVVGAGAWGSALANVCARAGAQTWLWGRDAAVLASIARERRHPRLPANWVFDEAIVPLLALDDLPAVDCAIFAVPFQTLAAVMAELGARIARPGAVACASKGFELDSGRLAHEIAADAWSPAMPFAQVSGPNFAGEVMLGLPAAITVGCAHAALGELLVRALHGPRFRAYLTSDVVGVEIGGALKNVMAIAAGIADGLHLGANSRAALITRGLAEMARFGLARGGRMETFMGLSGVGDLVLTCTDDLSRNRRFGLALGHSGDPERAAVQTGALVEGVPTARAVAVLAAAAGIATPIVDAVAAVVDGGLSPAEAVNRLLARDPTAETD